MHEQRRRHYVRGEESADLFESRASGSGPRRGPAPAPAPEPTPTPAPAPAPVPALATTRRPLRESSERDKATNN